jgi:MFS family permease
MTKDRGRIAKEATPAAIGVVGLIFCLGMLGQGLNGAFPVFVLPVTEALGLDRAAFVGLYAISMLVLGLAAPVIGTLFDRVGPRALALVGVGAMGAALVAASYADRLWQLQLTLGLACGVAVAALGGVMQATLLARWFRTRLSTAIAVGYCSGGVGGLIFSPFAQALIDWGGWRFAYRHIGIGVLLALVVLLLLPWRRIAAGNPNLPKAGPRGGAMIGEGPSLRDALRMAPFWVLVWSFGLTSVGLFALTPQIVARLVEAGFAPIQAASIFGFTTMLTPIGMIGAGWFADRGGREMSLGLTYSATIAGVIAFALIQGPGDTVTLGLFSILFGATMGSRAPVISSMAAQAFAGRSFGRIYGTITLSQGVGAALGAQTGGLIHDWTGNYQALCGFSAVALLVAAGPIYVLARRLRQRPPGGGAQ